MASFEEIDRARRRLHLRDAATLQEIKQSYKREAHRHHPDKADGEVVDPETMKRLNRAYEILVDYCSRYSYTFTREDVARTYVDEDYHRRYTYGWFHEA